MSAQRVAIRRASRLPEPMISTALIGWGIDQWYPHQPSGKRRYQSIRARSIVIARYARAGRHATARSDRAGYHRVMPDAQPTNPHAPMLRGERVWLRAITKADFIEDAAAVSDRDTGHFLGLKTPISAEGAAEFAQQLISQQGKTAAVVRHLPAGR